MTEIEDKITEKLSLQMQSKLDAMMTNIKAVIEEELKAATSLQLRRQHPRQTVIKTRAPNPPNVRNEKTSKTNSCNY
jgi:hypothetical protein